MARGIGRRAPILVTLTEYHVDWDGSWAEGRCLHRDHCGTEASWDGQQYLIIVIDL